MQIENFNTSGKKAIEGKDRAEVEWAKFCLAPDKFPCVRMPALFPINSHKVRRRITKTMTVGPGGIKKVIWAPEHLYGQGFLFGTGRAGGLDFEEARRYQLAAADATYHDIAPVYTPGNWSTDVDQFDRTDPLYTNLSDGGCKLIGAVLNIEYLGKTDDISGLIEIGMKLNSGNNPTGNIVFNDVKTYSDEDMVQSSYYKRIRLSEGMRTIWIPIDESRFEFNEAHAYRDVDVGSTEDDLDGYKVYATRMLVPTVNGATPAYPVHATATPNMPLQPGQTAGDQDDGTTASKFIISFYRYTHRGYQCRQPGQVQHHFLCSIGTSSGRNFDKFHP